MSNDLREQDCAICLQRCDHPTQLPCGHIFCFLCVKGVAIQSKKCAMCRAEIPSDYLDHPVLLEKLTSQTSPEETCEGYQWYYEGRNGWWKYDERSNIELENAFSAGDTECTLLLAGALYCIDFRNMIQVRYSDRTRRRRVQRDTPALPAKGIAGIKNIDTQSEETKNEEPGITETVDLTENSSDVGPVEIHDSSEDVLPDENSLSLNRNEVIDLVRQLSEVNLSSATRHSSEDT